MAYNKRKPGRRYSPSGRLIKIQMQPAKKCVIADIYTEQCISYDFHEKNFATIEPRFSQDHTIFASRTQARKALWHICQKVNSSRAVLMFEVRVLE